MNLSKKILITAAICIPFSSSFAQSCFDLREITLFNRTGAPLGTTVDNACSCHTHEHFNTGGVTVRTFTEDNPLRGRIKGDQNPGCIANTTKWVKVDFYLPSGAKFANWKYNYTGNGEETPFITEIAPYYQPYFEWVNKRLEGSKHEGRGSIELACKAGVSKQKCEDIAYGREGGGGHDLP